MVSLFRFYRISTYTCTERALHCESIAQVVALALREPSLGPCSAAVPFGGQTTKWGGLSPERDSSLGGIHVAARASLCIIFSSFSPPSIKPLREFLMTRFCSGTHTGMREESCARDGRLLSSVGFGLFGDATFSGVYSTLEKHCLTQLCVTCLAYPAAVL